MKRALKLLLSVALTLGFGWWAFRDTDFHQQWQSLRSANYLWLFPYLLTLGGIHLARTFRWGCLLSGIEKVRFKPLNEASAIGFMMLIVLPFRLGEFARPFLIAQRSNVRKSAAMTTVVLERIADGIAVAVMLRVLLFFVPKDAHDYRLVLFAGNVMFLIFFSGLMFLLFSLWQHDRAVRLVRATAGAVSKTLGDKVAGVVDTFVGAMRQLPSGGQRVMFFVWTIVYWGINGLGMSLLSRAFSCSTPGCDSFVLSPFQAFVTMGVLVVGVMIPAAPGMVGLFQAAIRVGVGLFQPMALVQTKGMAYANVLWFTQTVTQILTGLVFLSLSDTSFGGLAGALANEAQEEAQPKADAAPAPLAEATRPRP